MKKADKAARAAAARALLGLDETAPINKKAWDNLSKPEVKVIQAPRQSGESTFWQKLDQAIARSEKIEKYGPDWKCRKCKAVNKGYILDRCLQCWERR